MTSVRKTFDIVNSMMKIDISEPSYGPPPPPAPAPQTPKYSPPAPQKPQYAPPASAVQLRAPKQFQQPSRFTGSG